MSQTSPEKGYVKIYDYDLYPRFTIPASVFGRSGFVFFFAFFACQSTKAFACFFSSKCLSSSGLTAIDTDVLSIYAFVPAVFYPLPPPLAVNVFRPQDVSLS